MKRAISPVLNPAGIGAAIAAIYAAVVMIWNASHHHGVIDPQVIVAALGAAAFLYTRFKVTPVADPKDGDGHKLVHVVPPVPSNVTVVQPDVTVTPPPPAVPNA